MHLIMVPIKNSMSRQTLEQIIQKEEGIKEVAWYSVASKVDHLKVNQPQVVGSIKAIFGYEEEEWAHIIIKGSENVKAMAKHIRQSHGYGESQIYALPLMQL